jgi:hypothetical protein
MITSENINAYIKTSEFLGFFHNLLLERIRKDCNFSLHIGNFEYTAYRGEEAGFMFDIIENRHCSACEDEHFGSIFISRTDICKPNAIDIAMENYKKQLQEKLEKAEKVRLLTEERAWLAKEQAERETFERLKAKFGG